jgi:hypothetical protein
MRHKTPVPIPFRCRFFNATESVNRIRRARAAAQFASETFLAILLPPTHIDTLLMQTFSLRLRVQDSTAVLADRGVSHLLVCRRSHPTGSRIRNHRGQDLLACAADRRRISQHANLLSGIAGGVDHRRAVQRHEGT